MVCHAVCTNSMMPEFDICGATHRGRVRRHNEDHILVDRVVTNSTQVALSVSSEELAARNGMLFCVADGIGGAAGGETASRLALEQLDRAFHAKSERHDETIEALLQQLMNDVNDHVREAASRTVEHAGMGSTLSGVYLLGRSYCTFNAGDSRIYRYRNGLLKPLSTDDTLATLAVRSGAMSFEQAAHSPDSHILTNYVGAAEFSLAVHAGPGLRNRDTLLICSDGLYDMLDDDTLAECFQQFNAENLSSAEQARRLIEQANECGGRDNISLILIRVCHEPR